MKTKAEKNEKPLYQWIRGEKAGTIVRTTGEIIQDGDMEFMIFEDGSQCNTVLIGEWLLPIDSPQEAFILEEPKMPAPVIAPQVEQKEAVKKVNPIHELLEMSKKHDTTINVRLDLLMPSEELMKVIQDSYDDGASLIGDYIISNNRENILDQIEEIIRNRVIDATQKKMRRS